MRGNLNRVGLGAVIAGSWLALLSQCAPPAKAENGDGGGVIYPSSNSQGWFAPASPVRSHRGDMAKLVDKHADAHGIPRDFMHRLIRRESGYNPRAVGPRTPWGRAYGIGQMLCSTAAGLGEPDCSRLTRDPDRALSLSARYVRQGYDATGSWRGAAAFYHGGPNKALHGRKTAAYAQAVAGRLYVASAAPFVPYALFFGDRG